MKHTRISYVPIAMASILSLINVSAIAAAPDIETYFTTLKHGPRQELYNFLYLMPKGGDLHNHISGDPYAEDLINLGREKDYSIDLLNYTVATSINGLPFAKSMEDTSIRNATIDAWSMHNFNHYTDSGHDHFFNAFGKFNVIVTDNLPIILANIINHAGTQNVLYLELMLTPERDAADSLGIAAGWNVDLDSTYKKIIRSGQIGTIEQSINTQLSTALASAEKLLHCHTVKAKPGCQVKTKYLYQALRNQAPEKTFAEFIVGFEAARRFPDLVVGVNLVQPEDAPLSLAHYKLQMEMVAYLKKIYPAVKISLHAGELSTSIPNLTDHDLSFHIHDAVLVAGADRIGHGVDIRSEEKLYPNLLAEMARNKTLVEINLTSNKEILEVEKSEHPLNLYLLNKIPVSLSTDDEGILRTDLSTEYAIAAKDYNLTYATLKNISRNSLEYGFMPGTSLWTHHGDYNEINSSCADEIIGNPSPSTKCQKFLISNEKASLEWKLEAKFTKFENSYR